MRGHELGSKAFAVTVGLAAVVIPAAADDGTMTFNAGCKTGERIVIAGVGDLLFHNALQRQALTRNGTYSEFWRPLSPVLAGADLTYGNLEGPAAHGVALGGRAVKDPGRRWDGIVYGYQRGTLGFNYHPSVIGELKDSGFDVVSTANNHAADRGSLGIDRTIDALESTGLAFTGTRRRAADPYHRWAVKTKSGGMTVAWIACTYSTNGMPDRHDQALNCYTDRDAVFQEIRWNAQDPDVDAVILTPHWGNENSSVVKRSDKTYAREAIEAGASAVIGAHPHVLQEWEKVVTDDGRNGLIIYSTGNFISNQVSDDQRTAIVAVIELTRVSSSRAEVSAAGFVPTWVTRGQHRVSEMKIDKRRGERAFSAPLRRLPVGNHVTAEDFRNLPRACPVTANATQPEAGVR